MSIANRILSDITVHMKYARFIPELGRRENWHELVTRNKKMHIKQYPDLKEEIEKINNFNKSCNVDVFFALSHGVNYGKLKKNMKILNMISNQISFKISGCSTSQQKTIPD